MNKRIIPSRFRPLKNLLGFYADVIGVASGVGAAISWLAANLEMLSAIPIFAGYAFIYFSCGGFLMVWKFLGALLTLLDFWPEYFEQARALLLITSFLIGRFVAGRVGYILGIPNEPYFPMDGRFWQWTFSTTIGIGIIYSMYKLIILHGSRPLNELLPNLIVDQKPIPLKYFFDRPWAVATIGYITIAAFLISALVHAYTLWSTSNAEDEGSNTNGNQ